MATREDNLKYRYGIDQEEYDAILKSQGNKCKICDTKHTGHKPLCVDHCHNSTRVRGLLCKKCNTSLGLLREDPKIMVNAILYLDAYHKEETKAFTEAIQSLKQPEKPGRVWRNLLLDKDDDPFIRTEACF